MSELTLCNHCALRDIERRAEERGATVKVTRERIVDAMRHGADRAWYIVQESDRDKPTAWFMELTVDCCC